MLLLAQAQSQLQLQVLVPVGGGEDRLRGEGKRGELSPVLCSHSWAMAQLRRKEKMRERKGEVDSKARSTARPQTAVCGVLLPVGF